MASPARTAWWVALAWSGAAQVAWAGGGPPTDAYDGIRPGALDVHGFVDLYLQGGPGLPPSGVTYRAFDTRAGAPALELLRVTVARRPDWLGFRLDAAAGDTTDALMRADPASASHPALARALSRVEQAFASVALPVGPGLTVDAGKFQTPIGLEDNETFEAWSYSRSLLFTLGEPTVQTGVRATIGGEGALTASAFWLNGWNANVIEGDGMRSFALAASWRPSERLEASVVYAAGLERSPVRPTDPALAMRHLLDASAVVHVRPWLAFAATADYAVDAASGGVSWWGVAGSARCRLQPWLAIAVRGEHYDDPDGFTTGTPQRIAGMTATLEARARAGAVRWVARLEARRDRSDARAFVTSGGGGAERQDSLTLALGAAF